MGIVERRHLDYPWRHDLETLASSSLWALGQLGRIGMLKTGLTRLMMALAIRRRDAETGKTHIPEVQAA